MALRTMISNKYGSLKDFHQAFTEVGNRLSHKELSRQLNPKRFPYGPNQHWVLKIVELCALAERERITALCEAARNGATRPPQQAGTPSPEPKKLPRTVGRRTAIVAIVAVVVITVVATVVVLRGLSKDSDDLTGKPASIPALYQHHRHRRLFLSRT